MIWVGRRDQGILSRAVNRYAARLLRRLKRLFLDTQRYPEVPAWSLLQPKKSAKVAV